MEGNSSEKSKVDVILKVLLALDYMKLCVDHDKANGEGVPVDIVTMPDFVVDVDGADITEINNPEVKDSSGMLAPAKVGSRAGRVLSILAHLRDLDDEAFQLHYIAKTGRDGQAVLENRLYDHLLENKLQPLRFPLLTPTRLTRYTVLGRTTYEPVNPVQRQVLRSKEQDLLTVEELERHFYSPIEKIRNARALYFATDSIDQFEKLIDVAILGETVEQAKSRKVNSDALQKDFPGERHVFIDFSALHGEDGKPIEGIPDLKRHKKILEVLELFLERLKKEKSMESDKSRNVVFNTFLTFLLKKSKRNIYLKRLFSKLKMRDSKDRLLVFSDMDMIMYNGNKSPYKSVFNPTRPDSREALVAGLLLYRAVGAAWKSIPEPDQINYDFPVEHDWTKDLFPDPFKEKLEQNEGKNDPKEWPFDQAVKFASAMVTLWEKKSHKVSDIPDKRTLLYYNVVDEKRNILDIMHLKEYEETLDNFIDSFLDEWIININLLARDWIKKRINNEESLKAFIAYLFRTAAKQNISLNPSKWKKKGYTSNALKIASGDTIRAQFVLQTLRWISLKKEEKLSKYIPFELIPKNEDNTPINISYLTDLDGTLIQSSGLRKMCLRKAFLAMLCKDIDSDQCSYEFPLMPENSVLDKYHNSNLNSNDKISVSQFLDRCVELYHAAVYKRWEDWEEIFQEYDYYLYSDRPKDFRQVWNHPLSYPAFTCILNRLLERRFGELLSDNPVKVLVKAAASRNYERVLKILRSFKITGRTLERLKKTGVPDNILRGLKDIKDETFLTEQEFEVLLGATIREEYKKKILKYSKTGPREWLGEEPEYFHGEVAPCEAKHKRIFEYAWESYWDVNYQPFHQTHELLRTLRDVFGVRLYIATEGHHDSQVMKLKTAHLDRFFSEDVTLSTGAAANPHEDLRIIQEQIKLCDRQINSYNDILTRHPHVITVGLRNDLISEKETNEKHKDFLKIYEKEWEKFKDKKPGDIYALMITSVMAEPDRPIRSLRSLRHLVEILENISEGENKKSPVCFAMVGDRESKDIRPILKRCGVNTTVRLFTSDHKNEALYWEKPVSSMDKPVARFVAWSPSQVLLFLSHLQIWDQSLKYDDMPALTSARLAKNNGNLKDDVYQAMSWGEKKRKKEGGSTFSMINFLTIQSTVRDKDINLLSFARNIAEKLEIDRTSEEWDSYRFTFEVAEEIWRLVTRRPDLIKDRKNIARTLRDAICREIRQEILDIYGLERQAVDILVKIKFNCEPPAFPGLPNCIKNAGIKNHLSAALNQWLKKKKNV
ncbi:MAG: hypothetical protein PVH61_28375 [Candidatus Aminicenantes bacterium]|jgi:phosphoglycolate phosphatase-like HAD superfamily hydrolase